MAALAQRCQVIAAAPEAQPARIVSLNSLDKLDSAALAVRASPDTLERASPPPPSPPKAVGTYVEGAVSVLSMSSAPLMLSSSAGWLISD